MLHPIDNHSRLIAYWHRPEARHKTLQPLETHELSCHKLTAGASHVFAASRERNSSFFTALSKHSSLAPNSSSLMLEHTCKMGPSKVSKADTYRLGCIGLSPSPPLFLTFPYIAGRSFGRLLDAELQGKFACTSSGPV